MAQDDKCEHDIRVAGRNWRCVKCGATGHDKSFTPTTGGEGGCPTCKVSRAMHYGKFPCTFCEPLKSITFEQAEDESGNPCFYWVSPFTGKREKVANLWWPEHAPELTAQVESLFASLVLTTQDQLTALRRENERIEKSELQLVGERDEAEQALSQAYYLITGRSPEWSNLFGHKEALQEIDEAQTLLRNEVKENDTLTRRVAELETCLKEHVKPMREQIL